MADDGVVQLRKEQILASEDRPTESVDVPEWGGSVTIRALSAGEKDLIEQELDGFGEKTIRDIRAKLVGRSIINGDGKRMFNDSELSQLSGKSAAAIDRIYSAALRLNGMRSGDLDNMVGNSPAGQPE